MQCKRDRPKDGLFFITVDVIGRYSKTRHPEKTLEELQHIQWNTLSLFRFAAPEPPSTIRDVARRLGPAAIAEIVGKYRNGSFSTDLSAEYGIGKGTVLQILKDYKVSMRRQSMADAQKAEAARFYEAGDSLLTVASKTGFPKQSVRLAILSQGVQMRPPKGGVKAEPSG